MLSCVLHGDVVDAPNRTNIWTDIEDEEGAHSSPKEIAASTCNSLRVMHSMEWPKKCHQPNRLCALKHMSRSDMYMYIYIHIDTSPCGRNMKLATIRCPKCCGCTHEPINPPGCKSKFAGVVAMPSVQLHSLSQLNCLQCM